jgi:hypothetical protein
VSRDHGFFDDVVHTDVPLSRKPVRGAHDDEQRCPHERLGLYLGMIHGLWRESHVELPVRDPVADIFPLSDFDRKAKRGIARTKISERQG